MLDSQNKNDRKIVAWNMDTVNFNDKEKLPTEPNKIPQDTKLTSNYRNTLIWTGITALTIILDYFALHNERFGIAFGLWSMGTIIFWPYIAGLVTFIIFIREYLKNSSQS